MKVNKILVFCLIMTVLSGLVFAGGSGQKSGQKQTTICIALAVRNNPFCLALEQGAKEILEAQGINVVIVDGNDNQMRQNEQIRDFLAQGIAALIVQPRDVTGIHDSLLACKEKGVPVVIVDNPPTDPGDKAMAVSIIASNNKNAGAECAKDMMSRLPRGSDIVIMHNPSAGSCLERYDGFMQTQNGYFNVLQEYDGLGDLAVTLSKMDDALQSFKTLKGVFCINDPSAEGAARSIEAGKKQGILVYGVDGSPTTKQMIKDGQITGTGAQSPINIGREGAKVVLQVLKGDKNIQRDIVIPTFIINKENVGQYDLNGWQ
jgi:ribose transport system substrate-binding protein